MRCPTYVSCKVETLHRHECCEDCGDEGTVEHDDGPKSCSSCAKGAALDYEAEKSYGRLPVRLGTLTQHLDAEVKRGRVDNREAA